MNGSDSKEVAEVQKELRGRIFDRYDKKSSALGTLMTALIAFAVIFFVFVLFPYVTLEYQKHRIDLQIADIRLNIERQEQAVANQEIELDKKKAALAEQKTSFENLRAKLAAAQSNAQQRQASLQASEAKIAAATGSIAEVKKSLDPLRKVQDSIANFKLDADKNVRELRNYLSELESQYNSGAAQVTDVCPQTDRFEQTRCRVHGKVEEQIDRAFQDVAETVLGPLADVDQALAGDVAQRLQALRGKLDNQVVQNPDFWRSLDEKQLFYGNLENQLQGAADEIVQVIRQSTEGLMSRSTALSAQVQQLEIERTQLKADADRVRAEAEQLDGEVKNLTTSISKSSDEIAAVETALKGQTSRLAEVRANLDKTRQEAEAEREKIAATEEQIAKRLSSVQSPLGTLPIGLTEATLAFPVIIAIALLIASLMLADALRLRDAFHGLCRRLDPDAHVLGDRQVAMIAPLWLDPASRGARRWLAGGAFLLPALIFVLAVLLIVYSWTITDSLPVGGRVTFVAFAALYVAGTVMIVLGTRQLWLAWRSYGQFATGGDIALMRGLMAT